MKNTLLILLALLLSQCTQQAPTTNPCPIGYEMKCVAVTPPPPPPPSTGTFKTGVNGFPWFPLRLLSDNNIKFVRCYMSSGWAWQPGGTALQPLHQAETAESSGMDVYLHRAQSYGITPLLCVHQTPEWYRNTGRQDGANDYAPCKAGVNRADPMSYKDYSEFLFQLTARYGRVKFPDAVLRVDQTPRWPNDVINEKKSGLDLLRYLEVWNEQKSWKNGTPEQEAYLEPEVMAALMSACYDGHEGKLGAVAGVKTADPSMVMVMPGLEDFCQPYVAAMDTWFKANRADKKWPCDVMTVHHYSNRGNKQGQYPAQWVASGACLPTEDPNFLSVKDLVAIAHGMGKELWVTEFGADKRAPSGMHSKGVGMSDEQFQANIIMKSINAYKALGADAAFVFTGPDENGGADGGQFESSGIFGSEAMGYAPTLASAALKAYLQSSLAAQGLAKKSLKQEMPKASAFKRPM